MSLTTTRSTLMHAALAQICPQLREFDRAAFGKLRVRPLSHLPSLSSMPTEILLLIRSKMLPILIAHLIAISATSLQRYEASLRQLICPQCIFYNEYVYGLDVWKWHLLGPCSCPSNAARTRGPNPTQFRDRHHWLENYLSRKSLRFRGLTSPSSTIWDVVTDVLGEFGCEAVRMNAKRRAAGMVFLSRWDRQSILIVPLHPTSKDVLLIRLERDLGLSLDYNEPYHRFPNFPTSLNICVATELAPPTHLSSDATTFLLQFLQSIAGPLTVAISLPFSFITLLLTVLCYYCKPGALRLL
ncbi:hypothetical protein C8R43DRAFT_163685 [Mycena crocata]|nr:hypothetical protein C8R43DRAFT_163685 [Mycena crocata]